MSGDVHHVSRVRLCRVVSKLRERSCKGNADPKTFPAATSEEAKTGTYYVPIATESSGSKYSRDPKLAEELWEWTEQQLTEHGY